MKILVIIILIITSIAYSQIIHIPSDQPTIQAGIDSASDGDTVLVNEGHYFENISFKGKAITLASWYLVDGEDSHIDSTIIDGSQPTNPNIGSVVRFTSGEDTTSILYGFTITGGTGTYTSFQNIRGAGGIDISYAGAKIQYNKIVFNTIKHEHPIGGGIGIKFPTNPIVITDNIISNNIAESTMYPNGAGGIMCFTGDELYVLIANNIISHNTATSPMLQPVGGGIYVYNSNPIIRNNLISYNLSGNGGGLYITSHENGAKPVIINNTFVNNTATNLGGGACLHSGNNTEFRFSNSIFWGNSDINDTVIESEIVEENIVVEYSDVQGGYEGIGNINSDPMFVDTVLFYLEPTSQCIDGGNPSSHFNDIEDNNNEGFALYPAMGGLRNDMGYLGGNSNMVYEPTNVNYNYLHISNNINLSQNYPNPFNPSTTIKYSLPNQSNVTLKVFDVLGSEVATLVNKEQPQGNYEVEFGGSELTSGIYFYRLQAGEYVETRKMILLK